MAQFMGTVDTEITMVLAPLQFSINNNDNEIVQNISEQTVLTESCDDEVDEDFVSRLADRCKGCEQAGEYIRIACKGLAGSI